MRDDKEFWKRYDAVTGAESEEEYYDALEYFLNLFEFEEVDPALIVGKRGDGPGVYTDWLLSGEDLACFLYRAYLENRKLSGSMRFLDFRILPKGRPRCANT